MDIAQSELSFRVIFLAHFGQFCTLWEKYYIKKRSSLASEKLKKEWTILSILYFLYKTILNSLSLSPCLSLRPLKSLKGWTIMSTLGTSSARNIYLWKTPELSSENWLSSISNFKSSKLAKKLIAHYKYIFVQKS